jgi:hypothetical protein
MELAQYGSLGVVKRLSASKKDSENTPDNDSSASWEASSHPSSPLEAKEKNRIEKNRIE